MKDIVEIYCDGACKGNPGPGGWGVLLRYKEYESRICGGEKDTTNNRMELLAAIKGIETLIKENCEIVVVTDSQYVVKGMSEWINNWKRKNWRSVKNVDLWQQLDLLSKKHSVTWQWVKGHAGHEENEEADRLANEGLRKVLRGKYK